MLPRGAVTVLALSMICFITRFTSRASENKLILCMSVGFFAAAEHVKQATESIIYYNYNASDVRSRVYARPRALACMAPLPPFPPPPPPAIIAATGG